MGALNERIDIQCPRHYLIHHTERYFTVHHRGQTPGTFGLTLDLSKVGIPGKLQARHDVRMRYSISKGPDGHDVIYLTWDPDDRMVPRFSGTLADACAGDGRSFLTLEGAYDAPFGAVGSVFDAVMGRRIGAATARALLHDIKLFVESDYQIALATSLAESPKE